MAVKDFLNVAETAEKLSCTVGRVRQMLIAGEIHGYKANARAWMIHHKEVERVALERSKRDAMRS